MTDNPAPPSGKPDRWSYRIPSVLTALILLGPLAYPLLWKSPRYSLAWKIILTVLFTAATIYMIIGTWHIYALLLQHFKQAGLM